MKDNIFTIIFACILGLVCASLLAFVSQFTTPFRLENENADRAHNFMASLEIPIDKNWDTKELLKVFEEKVIPKDLGDFKLYEYIEGASDSPLPKAIAIEFSGAGLWGPIKGVIAFEPDLKTIRGIRFYQHEETPGLGGEISSEWFQNQFQKKQIISKDGTPGFLIKKPGVEIDINSVDGISGATMTSDLVQKILDTFFKELWKERSEYVR